MTNILIQIFSLFEACSFPLIRVNLLQITGKLIVGVNIKVSSWKLNIKEYSLTVTQKFFSWCLLTDIRKGLVLW
jgi:hypothetical protein